MVRCRDAERSPQPGGRESQRSIDPPWARVVWMWECSITNGRVWGDYVCLQVSRSRAWWFHHDGDSCFGGMPLQQGSPSQDDWPRCDTAELMAGPPMRLARAL